MACEVCESNTNNKIKRVVKCSAGGFCICFPAVDATEDIEYYVWVYAPAKYLN